MAQSTNILHISYTDRNGKSLNQRIQLVQRIEESSMKFRLPKGELSFQSVPRRPGCSQKHRSVIPVKESVLSSTNDEEEEEFKGLTKKENYLAHLNNLNNLKAMHALKVSKSRPGQHYLSASISNINSIDLHGVLSDIKGKKESHLFTAKAFVFKQKPAHTHNASQAALQDHYSKALQNHKEGIKEGLKSIFTCQTKQKHYYPKVAQMPCPPPLDRVPPQDRQNQTTRKVSNIPRMPRPKAKMKKITKEKKKKPEVSPVTPLAQITAKAFSVVGLQSGVEILGKQSTRARECASLTKIMTLWTTLRLCEKHSIDKDNTMLQTSDDAAGLVGTSAGLSKGGWLSINDLLYGMMLPSGNDAALSLAQGMGAILHMGYQAYQDSLLTYQDMFPHQPPQNLQEFQSKYFVQVTESGTSFFLQQMNVEGRRLQLKDSRFNNPHGLMDDRNLSTALDIARLTCCCWKNDEFRKVVGTRQFTGLQLDPLGDRESLSWENTNKLLSRDQGWLGGKTGITFKAGPCLMSVNRLFVVVILSSRTMDHRWGETQLLSNYASTL